MRTPTVVEMEHYEKLVGCRILSVRWREIDGQPMPVLVMIKRDKGPVFPVLILRDPEGNGPGHLDHDL